MGDRRGHRPTARQAVALGVVVVAGTGIGLGVSEATASGTPAYRTATVGVSSVDRSLAVSGVLEPVDQATTSFQVAGTVAGVAVAPGQQVQAGQPIATLDPTLLQQQVTAAQAALTAAQAKLTADENGQSTSTPSSGTGTSGGAGTSGAAGASTTATFSGSPARTVVLTSATIPSAGSGSGSGGGTSGGGTSQLARDQQAVVGAQHTADVDLQTAAAALSAVQQACPPAGSTAPTTTSTTGPATTTPATTTPATTAPATTTSPSSTPAPTDPTAPPSTAPTTTAPAGTVPPGTGSAGDACATALGQAEAAQQQVATDQQELASAESALAQLLATQAAAAGPCGAPGGGAGRSGTGPAGGGAAAAQLPTASRNSSANPAGSTGSSAAQAANSPAQLASDQAGIDTDSGALAQAEQALAAATLTSPLSGTVAAVAITPGQTVTAGSGTATITIINSGSYQTTASLTTTQVQSVKVGDRASLTVDGTAGSLEGTVSSVGPVDASGSSYTYPVTVAVTSGSGRLETGSTTRIRINVAQAHDALVVPTSAVHTASTAASFVYLDQSGKETRRRVTLGVVGPVYTQITSGLTAGQTVILADPSQAVPASSTNSSTRGLGGAGGIGPLLRGGVGGFGGAGLGGAGGIRTPVKGGAG